MSNVDINKQKREWLNEHIDGNHMSDLEFYQRKYPEIFYS